MPEGPEVRRYADAIGKVLEGQPIVALAARTRLAKQWLLDHPDGLVGKRIESIRSHGKNILGSIEGGFYFYSHLMMWGRWIVVEGEPPSEIDRRERARIVVPKGSVLLYSAPIFELGEGDPYQIEQVQQLGVDVLPYKGSFDAASFQQRLLAQRSREIGAALLDQQIVAGIGNYLRAEILFDCCIDPWRTVEELTPIDLQNLSEAIPRICRRAYETGGFTVSDIDRQRLQQDATLVYRLDSYGDRHYVFRRTNLPCLVCGTPVRQMRQTTRQDEDGEKSRIIYFCPTCQNTRIALKPAKRRAAKPSAKA